MHIFLYFCTKIVEIMLEEKRIETNSMKAWLLAARPKTLSGAAVPVMIGVALSYVDAKMYGDDVFSWVAAVLCLLFAFIMQIDANFINDFFDFANGTDNTETRIGPRRACAMGWVPRHCRNWTGCGLQSGESSSGTKNWTGCARMTSHLRTPRR